MGQSTTSREEPSMEDILSSIRSIIQNKDMNINEEIPSRVESQSEPEPISEPTSVPVREPLHMQEEAQEQNYHTEASVIPPTASSTDDNRLTIIPEQTRDVIENISRQAEGEPVSEDQSFSDSVERNTVSTLISPGSEAKVAASFAQLNEAFSTNSVKSIEKMTNETLRPMLQEWLDNNLPHLVERIVREEIERVARGHHDQ